MRQPFNPEQNRPYTARVPLSFWLVWMLTIVATAAYTWWDALSAGTAVDIVQVVLHSIVVGLIGLIVLTRIEERMAPWRFVERDPS
jgi:hypothetical protein